MFETQAALEGSTITFKNLTPQAFDIVRETDTLKQLPSSVMSQTKSMPAKLIGDQIRLTQVLINLCKNSLKFSPKGHIAVLSSFDPAENMLSVAVLDDGKGIKKEERHKLFTKFGKLERTA